MTILETQTTTNIKASNDLDILKTHFSHYFDKNGKFDLTKFQKELENKEVEISKESYGMDWLGKSYARVLRDEPAYTLLKENTEWNQRQENQNSENLLIKGDNLEVLKHLSNAYEEKIKMIYIDPPYNTGSDGFVYQDDRKFELKEFMELAGIGDEERAKKILSFTKAKSNSHSAWLTFMYPRLYIARQLLRDDGVIFVSIDDNEVAQLRLVMDEIFGEENFVAEFVWQKGKELEANNIGYHHEYVLLYSKFKNKLNLNLLPKDTSRHKNILPEENLVHGIESEYKKGELYQLINLSKQDDYDLEIPLLNGKILKRKGYLAPETLKDYIKTGRIFVGKKETVYVKSFLSDERDGSVISSIIESIYGTTKKGGIELKDYFNQKLFSYPKPTLLINHLVKAGSSSNDIILDFFAGSGTTGDAVMQLNSEDGGNRKFILVQLPEPIDEKKNKTAFDFVMGLNEKTPRQSATATPQEGNLEPTIFEITKERLIRTGKKIQLGQKEKNDKKASQLEFEEKQQNLDLGFKIFETMPIWEDYEFIAEKLEQEGQELFDESKLTEEDLQTLLTTWQAKDGILLTENLAKIDLDSYFGYYHHFKQKLYLMDKGFETKNLVKLIGEIDENPSFNPKTIVCFGHNWTESMKIRETFEGLKNYSNKKKSDIDLEIRY